MNKLAYDKMKTTRRSIMTAPLSIPVHSTVDVELEDSCNCSCCFNFPKRKTKNVRQNVKVDDTDVMIMRIHSETTLSKKK
jgi:hypothetical protein